MSKTTSFIQTLLIIYLVIRLLPTKLILDFKGSKRLIGFYNDDYFFSDTTYFGIINFVQKLRLALL